MVRFSPRTLRRDSRDEVSFLQRIIGEWVYEAGPALFKRTVESVDEGVDKANAEAHERKALNNEC
jgi:hypothetical protein